MENNVVCDGRRNHHQKGPVLHKVLLDVVPGILPVSPDLCTGWRSNCLAHHILPLVVRIQLRKPPAVRKILYSNYNII